MAKFKINAGYGDESTVEAHRFSEENSLVIFVNEDGWRTGQVFAMRVDQLPTIERLDEGTG
ncbi:hypothetical protein [Nocardia sp. NPDC023988]|uniref:hypothetical protein n=1 Tax=unclassified Nocardia TaxID=2637762 RepID=UPI0033F29FB9